MTVSKTYFLIKLFSTRNSAKKQEGQKPYALFLRTVPALVEPAGVEPASKHMPDKLSTCLFLHWFSGNSRNRTNLLFPYLLRFSTSDHSALKLIPLFVDSAAGTATGGLPGGYKGCLISD